MLPSGFSLSSTGGRVLVVAASSTLARTVVVTLRGFGYKSEFAPELPFEWQHTLTSFDLLILVSSRPFWFRKSSFDICSAVRQESLKLPIIVVGRDDPEAKVRLLETGADDYIVEPFDPHEFLLRVRGLIRRCQLY